MDFSVGNIVWVDGNTYTVRGMIIYKNTADGYTWKEYRLIEQGGYRERWLSIDNHYKEYSISEVVSSASDFGYHKVDEGVEVVAGAWGDVDVEVGDRARFVEMEDSTEEKIISYEYWDDGTEISKGYYLDANEFRLATGSEQSANSQNTSYSNTSSFNNYNYNSNNGKNSSSKLVFGILAIIGVLSFILSMGSNSVPKIDKYLMKTNGYELVTAITGSAKQKAKVYKASANPDKVARDIIDYLNGQATEVEQNTEDEDNSIAILTKTEICVIYQSTDNETLVQISNRKYAYASEQEMYHSHARSHRFYRRFYHSRGYVSDQKKYSSVSSSYTNYTDSDLGSNSMDTYKNYNNSVRQASIASRESAGGGTSYGK